MLERRPIAARNTRWAAAGTRWLLSLGMSPNSISVAGMIAGIGAGLAFASTSLAGDGIAPRVLWLAGALLIELRLLANLFDGMVAVESGRTTRLGELFNEVPDRVSDAAVLVGAGYGAGGDMTLGFAAATVAIFVAYVRAVAKASGAPSDFSGPMAKPQRMQLMALTAAFLGFAPSGWHPGWGPGGNWGLIAATLAVIVAGGTFTAARRAVRAARALGTE
ncbi:MAG: CDP-alcohol phosphatidyltransferase family protein [Chloroflexi bacterium]|nr:CDP-alcohol phosphatidyltransferase family protein [Chloroflexota bacterium]